MKGTKPLEEHKAFSLYPPHLGSGFIATQLRKIFPNRAVYPTVQKLLRVRDGEKLARRQSIPMAMQGPLGLLCVQHLERAIAVPKPIFSFCPEYPSLLQFSIMNKSRVFFHVIWIRSHNEVLGVLEVVFISVFFPARIVALVGNVTLSDACFKFSEVKPRLIIL